MDSWVAFDFETANEHRGSPCQVGLVAVEGGQIVERLEFYIRPPEFRFSGFNVALHGITPDMCEDAPEWGDALATILKFTNGRPLVGHYAAFDTGVIRDTCDALEMEWPDLDYACTLVISRRTWTELPSHSLPFVAARCGVLEFDHHDALADAEATARIALAAMEAHGVSTLGDLVAIVGAHMGRIDSSYWRGCRLGSIPRVRLTELVPRDSITLDPNHPLFDKTVTFTGELAIVRREAQQFVVDCGGHVAPGPSKKVDYLVTGYQDVTRLAVGAEHSGKFRKAEALRAKGHHIDIITERDFWDLVRSDGYEEGDRLLVVAG